ncbi:MAG: right-handed parallel beta-helix repeat-containing protein [Candidatus Hermodarchaeota archaeon]
MKQSKLVMITILIILLFALNSCMVGLEFQFTTENEFLNTKTFQPRSCLQKVTGTQSYIERGPITITSDFQLNNSGFPGNGTIDDPIRIEGYNITYSSGTLIYIRDTTFYFEITNNYLNGLSSASRGIYLYNVIHGTIRNNIISSCGQGIEFWYSNDNVIINNTVFNNNYNGVKFHFTSNNNKIINNTIYDNIQESGIWLEASSNVTITDNIVYMNDDNGIKLDSCHNCRIINNSVYNNSFVGIRIDPSSSKNNSVIKNEIYNNSEEGLSLYFAENTTVRLNKIYGNGWNGIDLGSSKFNTLSSNTIINNNENGISLWGESNTNTICNNTVYNNNLNGINVDSSNNNTIYNNTVNLNTQNGIHLNNANDNTIADNRIHDNYFTGIYLHNSDNNTLFNNTLTNNYFNLIKTETLLTPVQEGIYDFTVTIQNMSVPVSANSVPFSWENVYYELPLENGFGTLDENVVDLDLNGDSDKIDLFDVTWFYNETRSWDAIINDGFQDIHAYSIYEGLPEDPGRYRTYYIDGESKLFQLGTKMHSLYMVNKDLAVFGLEDVIILNHPSPNFVFVTFSPVIDVTDFHINNAPIEVNYTRSVTLPQFGWDLTCYIIPAQTIGSAEVITFSCMILTQETMINNVGFRMNWSPDGNTRSQWDFFTQEISLIGDNTPPTVIINKPLPQTYATDTITVALSGDADNYWYYIESVDSQNQTWTTSVGRMLTDGTYTLHVYGNDSVGNVAHVFVTFTIETPVPTTLPITTTTTTTTPSSTTTTSATTIPTKTVTPGWNVLLLLLTLFLMLPLRHRKKKS